MCVIDVIGSWVSDHTTVLATVVTACATAAIAWFTIRLAQATTIQAALTRAAVDLGNKEFIATHRPRLRFRRAFNVRLVHGQRAQASLEIANVGDTDATIIAVGIDIFFRIHDPARPDHFSAVPQPWKGMALVKAGQEMRAEINGGAALTGADLAEILDPEVEGDLCLLGVVNYRDNNGTLRSTAFFRVYSDSGKRFVRASDTDEYADLEYEN